MVKTGNCSIIQFGSTWGTTGQDLSIYEKTNMHENITYAAIKRSIINPIRQMASLSWSVQHSREYTLSWWDRWGHIVYQDNQNPVFIRKYSKKIPLKCLERAEDVASTTLFLGSDASTFITSATIIVEGGWTCI